MREKRFAIPGERIKPLLVGMGGCFATDHITVEGRKVGFMYRDIPDESQLSGWTFLSAEESQEYADDPDNWAIYDVNTICNYDPAIIPYLHSPFGTAFGRVSGTDRFEREANPPGD